jgi:hypothetical protein
VMINFKIFLEYSFKSGFDETKKIILGSASQISKAVHNALPDGISLQNNQVLFHQLKLPIPLAVNQLPHQIQFYFIVDPLLQHLLLSFQELIEHFRSCSLLEVLPL